MRLLDRYMLRELLVPLGLCLGGFYVFWVSFDLLTELSKLQAHKLRGPDVLEYYVVRSPEFIVTVLPMALLLAVLYALGRHTRYNELVAVRVAGLSVWRVCTPHIAVGLVASLVFFALNELWVPDTEQKAERVLNRRVDQASASPSAALVSNYGFANPSQKRTWQFRSFNPHTAEMTEPKIDWERSDGTHLELIAKHAIWVNGVWIFYDAWQNIYRTGIATNPAAIDRSHFDRLPVPAFTETPQQIRTEIKISTRLSKRTGKRADIPLAELCDYIQRHPELAGPDRAWFYTKLHGRIAAPWACLVAVLIAIPFGAGLGFRSVYVSMASSIGLGFAYFVLMQIGLAVGTGGYVPPWVGAWLPNCVFGLGALGLLTRVR